MPESLAENYLASVLNRFRYYKELGEKSMVQLPDAALFETPSDQSNSIAVMVQHLAGNMLSRWTGFLSSDGEKSWRRRDSEFESVLQDREALMSRWEEGWQCLFDALALLQGEHLTQSIRIRGQALTVVEAINRQLTHYAYHVGQMVYVARWLKGDGWISLSIPRGESETFNQKHFSQQDETTESDDNFSDLTEDEIREVAAQLRRPQGDFGHKVAAEMSKSNRVLSFLVYDMLRLQPGEAFMEAGMGNGAFFPEIAGRLGSGSLSGLDYSPEMVASAKKQLSSQNVVRVDIREGDIENMPFDDQAFDKICTINTAYFWSDTQKALAEFHRVLRPNGLFAIGFRTPDSLRSLPFIRHGFTLYTIPELTALVTANGFSLVQREHRPDDKYDAACLLLTRAKL